MGVNQESIDQVVDNAWDHLSPVFGDETVEDVKNNLTHIGIEPIEKRSVCNFDIDGHVDGRVENINIRIREGLSKPEVVDEVHTRLTEPCYASKLGGRPEDRIYQEFSSLTGQLDLLEPESSLEKRFVQKIKDREDEEVRSLVERLTRKTGSYLPDVSFKALHDNELKEALLLHRKRYGDNYWDVLLEEDKIGTKNMVQKFMDLDIPIGYIEQPKYGNPEKGEPDLYFHLIIPPIGSMFGLAFIAPSISIYDPFYVDIAKMFGPIGILYVVSLGLYTWRYKRAKKKYEENVKRETQRYHGELLSVGRGSLI